MAYVLSVSPLPFLRGQSDCRFILSRPSVSYLSCLRLQRWCISAVSKKKSQLPNAEYNSNTDSAGKGSKKTPRTPRRSRKKAAADIAESSMEIVTSNYEEITTSGPSSEKSKKTVRKSQKKASSSPVLKEEKTEKIGTRRRSLKKIEMMDAPSADTQLNSQQELTEPTISPILKEEKTEKRGTRRRSSKRIEMMDVPSADTQLNSEEELTEPTISPILNEEKTEKTSTRIRSSKKIEMMDAPIADTQLNSQEELTETKTSPILKEEKTEERGTRRRSSETIEMMDAPSADTQLNSQEELTEMKTSPILKEEKTEERGTRRRSSKTIEMMDAPSADTQLNSQEELTETKISSSEQQELQLVEDDRVDISHTYGWPPLVCCFGAAQYAFIPSGRPANRLIDHEIHESMKDMFWSPDKFVRAPGGPSSSVARALAAIGGRVAFMGKLGDDDYGQNMLNYLNMNSVRTRSVKLDRSKSTAVSHMKISRRGGLRMSCSKPCAEDCFLSSDIDIAVLQEAKMFYFNSSSLLDQSMRATTLQAIKISKKFGGVVFFDPNLSLPLWKSSTETKTLIQEAWKYADIIEVTKQELEFLCGIKPSEKFDTKDNDKSKFVHYGSGMVMQLWHENLKVLFVTNGTSKIHYYTAEDNGSVHGMEDPPITPFTGDMSVSGDAIVAALMRMLTVEPHLITDKGYLECSIKYAISCGVIDQWLLARTLGFPAKQGMELSENGDVRFESITEREYRTVEEAVG